MGEQEANPRGDRPSVPSLSEEGLLVAIVESTDDAVYTKDLEGRIASWNRGAERIYGYAADEIVGQPVALLIPDDRRNEEVRILDRIRRGERVQTYETERLRKDGQRIDVALTVSPIETPDLGVVGAASVSRDVTEAKRRRKAQEFLARAAAALDASLDVRATARTIVETAVPELAEVCLIDRIRPDGMIGDSVVASVDAKAAAELEEIRDRFPLDPAGEHPVAQVLRSRRPMVWRDLTSPRVVSQVAQSDEHKDFMARAGYRSAAVVRLVARGRTLGALSFLHAQRDVRYDEGDLALLQDLANRAAIALDNASLYEERDRVARTLQRGLRPERTAEIPGVETAIVFEAAGEGIEVGGDFYDVFETADGWMILIGDVAGKGSEAATFTAQIRHSVRAMVLDGKWRPDSVLGRLNELLLRGGIGDRFASAVLAKLRPDGDGMEIELSNGGHPPPILLCDGGPRLLGHGPLLGVWADPGFELETARLGPGNTFLLYTDGLLEAGKVEDHIDSRALAEELARSRDEPLSEMTERLRADALRRSSGRLEDDLVLLALQSRGGGPAGNRVLADAHVHSDDGPG